MKKVFEKVLKKIPYSFKFHTLRENVFLNGWNEIAVLYYSRISLPVNKSKFLLLPPTGKKVH